MLEAISSVAPAIGFDPMQHAGDPGTAQGQTTVTQSTEADKQTFASMMQSPDVDTVAKLSPAAPTGAPSLLEKAAMAHNSAIHDIYRRNQEILQAGPNMTMAQMVSYGNEMTMSMAITTSQFSVATTFGKSAGKGVDTLMRNQ